MERRFEVRKQEMLAECEVPAGAFDGTLAQLREFVVAFAARLGVPAQRVHAETYVAGLVSSVERKNVESIAYSHDQERGPLQYFIGEAEWDDRPLVTELVDQVANELGDDDAVLVFDPSSFPKKGTESVGVQRQWCGRLGKIDNCQVAVYMAYVTRGEPVLVDTRLYLPREWAQDKKRRRKCGVPKAVRFRTRHELVLEMLREHGPRLPHRWVAGDEELGRVGHFRRKLQGLNERYVLDVPANTCIRDLQAPLPPYAGRGRHPQQPFQQIGDWHTALPKNAWRQIDVRDTDKGPLVVAAVKRRVQARTDRKPMEFEETLLVIRLTGAGGDVEHHYHLSNAPPETPLEELVRVAHAEHRVEQALKYAKSEAGLADYEVRNWRGWHHHQTLSLVGTWFLVLETRRGGKIHAGLDRAAGAASDRTVARRNLAAENPGAHRALREASPTPQRTRSLLPPQTPQLPAALAS